MVGEKAALVWTIQRNERKSMEEILPLLWRETNPLCFTCQFTRYLLFQMRAGAGVGEAHL